MVEAGWDRPAGVSLSVHSHIVQAFYVKKRPFTEQIATEAFSTGFGLVRYPL